MAEKEIKGFGHDKLDQQRPSLAASMPEEDTIIEQMPEEKTEKLPPYIDNSLKPPPVVIETRVPNLLWQEGSGWHSVVVVQGEDVKQVTETLKQLRESIAAFLGGENGQEQR